MNTTTALRAALTSLGAFAFFSFADTAIKQLSQDLPITQVTVMVMVVSLVTLVAFSLATGRSADILPRYPALAIARALLLAVDTLLFFYALTKLPLTDVYVVAFTNPIMVSILAFVILREKLTPMTIFAIVLGFIGVLVALQPGSSEIGIGHLAVFTAIFLFALSLLLLRVSKPDESDIALVTTMLAILAGIALVMSLLGEGFSPITLGQAGIVLLGAGGTVIGHVLMVRAFRMANAGYVAPFAYTQLVWGVLYGWLIFGDQVAIHTLIGAAIIIVSGLILIRKGG